jgi:hypothetical protein
LGASPHQLKLRYTIRDLLRPMNFSFSWILSGIRWRSRRRDTMRGYRQVDGGLSQSYETI